MLVGLLCGHLDFVPVNIEIYFCSHFFTCIGVSRNTTEHLEMRLISVLSVVLLLIGSAVTALNREDYERAITWLQNAGFLELQVSYA